MTTPSMRDLINLEVVLEVRLSPRGDRAAIRVEHPHWEEDRYCCDVVVIDVESLRRYEVTRFARCEQIRWLDDDTLAVLKSDGADDDKAQVYVYEGLVGDGWQVTNAKHGVDAFEPFGRGIVFLGKPDEEPEVKAREDRFGTYSHVESEPGDKSLFYTDLEQLRNFERATARATRDEKELLLRPQIQLSAVLEEPVAIQTIVTSPAADAVYLNVWPTDDLTRERESSVYRIEVDADAAVAEYLRREEARSQKEQSQDQEDYSYFGSAQRLALPIRSSIETTSPDGSQLLIRYPSRDSRLVTNAELWVGERDQLLAAETADAAAELLREVTAGLEEPCYSPVWHDHGIDVVHAESTRCVIQRLDPEGKEPPRRLDTGDVWCQSNFTVNVKGQVGFVGVSSTDFAEAWILTEAGPVPLSDYGSQLAQWDLGEVRTIRWTSRDGTEVEGVLRLPPGFDESRRHPLAFVVHGGPTSFDSEELLPMPVRRYYPAVQLAAEGVMVLQPNYRGSLGRGQKFRELNIGNLGVGDLWDLESAIDHLDQLGWVDTDRVGSMGWSQGGYISAFAGTHSQRFAAVSVGAGISDWYTYAISNDIPDFTRDFLDVQLFDEDRSALSASAPIAALGRANTPMLIQHGAKDQRVPLSNAMELYRGLQERGVPVELFVYPDFEHSVTKPREKHAVMHQNLGWFRHWLLGEDLELE